MLLPDKSPKKREGLIPLHLIAAFAFFWGSGCHDFLSKADFSTSDDVRHFIEDGGDPNRRFFYGGNPKTEITLLRFAVYLNDADLATFLLDRGVDANTVDYFGQTPAASIFSLFDDIESRREIMDLLVPVTDPSIRDAEGRGLFQVVETNWGQIWLKVVREIYDQGEKGQKGGGTGAASGS